MEDRRSEDLTARLRRLEALREVSLELTSERDLQRLLSLIMARTTQILDADRSTLYLVEHVSGEDGRESPMLVSRVAQGVGAIRLPLDESSIAGAVAVRGEVLNIEDAYAEPRFNPSFDRLHQYRTRSMLTAPMRNPQGQVIGVTQAINKRGNGRFDLEDEDIMLAFASQACIAIEDARYLELQRLTFETLIQGQAVAIDARDHITAGHTWRVTAYAVEIGRALGWRGEDLELLRYAGLLHDQGKLGVPDDILMKAGRLSDWEFRIIQSHAYKTKAILESVRPLFPRRLKKVPEIAASHHEKLDGSGYPDGLKGEALSMGARIVAVADIFDALTAHRPYRDPDPDDVVLEMLRQDALGGKLDMQVVQALAWVLPRIVEIRQEINDRIEQQGRVTALPHVLKEG
jgi:HD-GYP domain-containing protein (c-di-GMP phosphodiesterase class II)